MVHLLVVGTVINILKYFMHQYFVISKKLGEWDKLNVYSSFSIFKAIFLKSGRPEPKSSWVLVKMLILGPHSTPLNQNL